MEPQTLTLKEDATPAARLRETLLGAGIHRDRIYEIEGEWPALLFLTKLDSKSGSLSRLFPESFELFISTRPLELIENSGSFQLKRFYYRNGFVAFNSPGSSWSIEWEGTIEGASLVWDPSVLNKAAIEFFDEPLSCINWRVALSDHMPAIAFLGLDIASQVTSGYSAGRAHVDLLMQSLLAMCIRRYSSSPSRDTSLVGVMSRQVLNAVNFINLNMNGDISLEDICKASACSTAHLNRLFRTELGISVWEYVQQRRIQRAGELLITKDIPIFEVASSLGFTSRSNFIRRFKNTFGCTPSLYRKSYPEK